MPPAAGPARIAPRPLSEISRPCSQWRPGSMLQLRGGMRSKNAGQLPPRLSFHAAPPLRLARIATCVQGSLLDCDGIAQCLHARSCADGVGPSRSGLSRLLQSSRFARWPAYRRTSSVTLRSSRPRAFEWCGLCGSRASLTCRRVYFCRVQHPIFPLRRLLNH